MNPYYALIDLSLWLSQPHKRRLKRAFSDAGFDQQLQEHLLINLDGRGGNVPLLLSSLDRVNMEKFINAISRGCML